MRGCSSACVGGWGGDGGGCSGKGGGERGDVCASVRRCCRESVSWNLNDLDNCAETNNESHQQRHHFATRTNKQKKMRPIMRAINRGIASR